MSAVARYQPEELLIENAQFCFKPNFEGRAEQFNEEGNRYFNVALTEDQANAMIADGWNVKTWTSKTAEDPAPVWFLKVAVSFRIKPPRVVLITAGGRTPLPEEDVDMLDWLELDFFDVTINGSRWNKGGRSGKKAYLKTIMAIVREDPLEKKYAHLPLVGLDPILALPPAEDQDILDGEVLDEWETDDDQLALEA